MTQQEIIRLAEDTLTSEDLSEAAGFLVSGARLTKGPQTLEFEKEFKATLGADYAVYVNSGSSANLLVAAALKESGRLRNNVVVCPAISWVTTVTPFTHLGFEVILCDSEPDSLGIDPNKLEEIFQHSRPSALVIVHVLGHPNDMSRIGALCEEYDVTLIEDACEALGTVGTEGEWVGTSGLAGTFSFYFGHHMSTIEGGMVVTSDFEFWQLMVSLRSHGWSRDLDSDFKAELTNQYDIDAFKDLYTFYWPGFNFRSTDFQAFLGRLQLRRISEISEIRQENFLQYADGLQGFWQQGSKYRRLSSFAFGSAAMNRQEVAEELERQGIESRPLICGNIGRHPFWMRHHSQISLPVADFIHDFGLYLPNHANLSPREVSYVVDVFRSVAIPAWPPSRP